jgi:hypothetical protein
MPTTTRSPSAWRNSSFRRSGGTVPSVVGAGFSRPDHGPPEGGPHDGLRLEQLLPAHDVFDLGSIEVGNHADLAVLDRDYFTVPEDDITRIRSVLTVVGGRVVHMKDA